MNEKKVLFLDLLWQKRKTCSPTWTCKLNCLIKHNQNCVFQHHSREHERVFVSEWVYKRENWKFNFRMKLTFTVTDRCIAFIIATSAVSCVVIKLLSTLHSLVSTFNECFRCECVHKKGTEEELIAARDNIWIKVMLFILMLNVHENSSHLLLSRIVCLQLRLSWHFWLLMMMKFCDNMHILLITRFIALSDSF
jgi:hypothetical protein